MTGLFGGINPYDCCFSYQNRAKKRGLFLNEIVSDMTVCLTPNQAIPRAELNATAQINKLNIDSASANERSRFGSR